MILASIAVGNQCNALLCLCETSQAKMFMKEDSNEKHFL